MSITTTAADFLLRMLPLIWSAGAVAHLLYLGVDRGWRVVAGAERLDRDAMSARDRLAARKEALAAAKHRADDAEKLMERLTQRIKAAEREAVRLEERPPSFIHVLGGSGDGGEIFYANVVRAASKTAGSPPSPIWRYANTLEIHAASRDAARAAAERAFPEKVGYLVVFKN